jgi:hypothetical protein
VSGVFAEEFAVYREQAGIQILQNAGEVNLCVFGVRMIAMNEKSDGS